MVATLPFDEAAALLGALRSGAAGDEVIPDPPILVVDADVASPVTEGSLRPPRLLPCVVVAVGSASGYSLPGADIYLADRTDPPRPWVGINLDAGDVERIVRDRPLASTTLCQVLRSRTEDVERNLVLESLAYATLQGGTEHRDWLAGDKKHRSDGTDRPAVMVDRTGDRLRITLDRPEKRNAYSARMRDELVAALQLACVDPTIASVELTGNGSDFCSGGDLAEFGTVEDAAIAHNIRMARNAGFYAHATSAQLTAFLHGACVGAGVEIPAFAGRVIAAPGTTFRLPEISMGLIPGAGGTASIPKRIGPERAAWLALSGRELDAQSALRWGLVDALDDGARTRGAG